MIALGCDHGGYDLMQEVIAYLDKNGLEYKNFGCDNAKDAVDYPDYAKVVAESILSGECDKGILICGTGIGIGLAAGKVKGVLVCTCSEPYSARMSRKHNNTNVLTFGARVIGVEMAKMIVDEWLDNEYEGGRHQRRVDMIFDIENK